MSILNITTMISNINLPALAALEVDKKELFLKVLETTVHIHNLPTEKMRYDEIEQLIDELDQWNEFELSDFIHYLLKFISGFKKRYGIPNEIKLRPIRVVDNRVACFVRLSMCAKATAEMYELTMQNYSEQLEEVINEEDVIDNPTFEDLDRMNV